MYTQCFTLLYIYILNNNYTLIDTHIYIYIYIYKYMHTHWCNLQHIFLTVYKGLSNASSFTPSLPHPTDFKMDGHWSIVSVLGGTVSLSGLYNHSCRYCQVRINKTPLVLVKHTPGFPLDFGAIRFCKKSVVFHPNNGRILQLNTPIRNSWIIVCTSLVLTPFTLNWGFIVSFSSVPHWPFPTSISSLLWFLYLSGAANSNTIDTSWVLTCNQFQQHGVVINGRRFDLPTAPWWPRWPCWGGSRVYSSGVDTNIH